MTLEQHTFIGDRQNTVRACNEIGIERVWRVSTGETATDSDDRKGIRWHSRTYSQMIV
jgi:hypothetical protein